MGYSPCKILTFGQKSKFQETSQNTVYKSITYSCSVQKTASKNTKYSRNETILRIGNHPRAIAHAKSSLSVKNQNSKKTCQNTVYKSITVVLCKKVAPKTTKYSRNETNLKIGHHANAIAHAKSTLWVKN